MIIFLSSRYGDLVRGKWQKMVNIITDLSHVAELKNKISS